MFGKSDKIWLKTVSSPLAIVCQTLLLHIKGHKVVTSVVKCSASKCLVPGFLSMLLNTEVPGTNFSLGWLACQCLSSGPEPSQAERMSTPQSFYFFMKVTIKNYDYVGAWGQGAATFFCWFLLHGIYEGQRIKQCFLVMAWPSETGSVL